MTPLVPFMNNEPLKLPAEKEMTDLQQAPRILIVEDEMLVAMLLENMVLELGYAVAAIVGQEKQAVDILQAEAIDFAILDVNLGGKQSYAIADALCERKIPFAFSTGYGLSAIDRRYHQWPVLNKPFRIEDLEQVLATIPRT